LEIDRDHENTKPCERTNFQRQVQNMKTMKEMDFKQKSARIYIMSGLEGDRTENGLMSSLTS
jgi:hypothetical protein